MIVRGRLVGVIDLQATRLERVSRTGPVFAATDRRTCRGLDRERAPLSPAGPAESDAENAGNLSQEFSSILDLDDLLGKIARTIRTLVAFDAFSILLVDSGASCSPPLQRALRSARGSGQYTLRQGITGAAV